MEGAPASALANGSTVATFIDSSNRVTALKGYKYFSAGYSDYTDTDGDNNVLVVYNLNSKNDIDNIANIYVFNAAEQKTKTNYVYANGLVEKFGSDFIYGWFEGGRYVEYVSDNGKINIHDGDIYSLEINSNGKFIETFVENVVSNPPAEGDVFVVFQGIVKSVSDGYVKVSLIVSEYNAGISTVYYLTNDSHVYDISAGNNSIKPGTMSAKNVVTFVAEYDKNISDMAIVDAYILESRYTDFEFEYPDNPPQDNPTPVEPENSPADESTPADAPSEPENSPENAPSNENENAPASEPENGPDNTQGNEAANEPVNSSENNTVNEPAAQATDNSGNNNS